MVVGQGMRSRLGQSARDTSRGFSCPEKIMSGGQAAADRAGLDFAIEAGLENGGFVPRGRRAEDGQIPEHYQLTELSSISYAVRTKRNLREADDTVVFGFDSILIRALSLIWRLVMDGSRVRTSRGSSMARHRGGRSSR